MKYFCLFVCCLFFGFGHAQNRKGMFHIQDDDYPHLLYVAFADGNPDVYDLQNQYGFTLGNAHLLTDASADAISMRSEAALKSVQRLQHVYLIALPMETNQTLVALASDLEKRDDVRYCELLCSKPVPPPADIAPTTPNFFTQQTYIQSNPGVNMQYAWNLGLTGTGIRIRDVEYGFNKNHEEFVDNANVFLQPATALNSGVTEDYTEHGTAVAGILMGDNGGYGVTGMVHGASALELFPEWTQDAGYNPYLAVSNAINASDEGDVIVLEMQAYGLNDQFVPSEYLNLIWDLTEVATQAGITVVAAAGNGNVNLDSPDYQEYMNRGDSGAILVGAGSADTGHNKISYSTFGSRVNLQAWGNNVRSTGYGNYATIGSDFNQRYCTFTGTSSATPLVAACAVALQSHYHAQTGQYLAPLVLRQLLIDTGIAQGTGGHIGPIPNMQPAIEAVNALASQQFGSLTFALYPNPAKNEISLSGNFSDSIQVELFNAMGQNVLKSDKANIDVSRLASGVYFAKVCDGGKVGVKRLVKI